MPVVRRTKMIYFSASATSGCLVGTEHARGETLVPPNKLGQEEAL